MAPDSIHHRCLQAIAALIRNLGLDGLDPAHVYIHQSLENPNVMFPAVILSFAGLKEARGEEDSIGMVQDGMLAPTYQIWVHVADRSSPFDDAKIPTYLLWRQQLMAFGVLDGVQLVTVPEVWVTKVRPQDVGPVTNEQKMDFFLSSFVVECHSYTAGVA